MTISQSSAKPIMIKAWISLHSGKRIAIEELTEDQIVLSDIIHSLSNICRFGGHCNEFYSVAEHSVRLAIECPLFLKQPALLHDMAEAYINDITSFLKRKYAPDIVKLEDDILIKIYHKFHVDYSLHLLLKPYESKLLATEVRDIMPEQVDFVESKDGGFVPLVEPYIAKIEPVPPKVARIYFERLLIDNFMIPIEERHYNL